MLFSLEPLFRNGMIIGVNMNRVCHYVDLKSSRKKLMGIILTDIPTPSLSVSVVDTRHPPATHTW